MSCSQISSTQLAVIAAVILVIADVLAMIAAFMANDEAQQSKADTRRELEAQIKQLQDKLLRNS